MKRVIAFIGFLVFITFLTSSCLVGLGREGSYRGNSGYQYNQRYDHRGGRDYYNRGRRGDHDNRRHGDESTTFIFR